MDWFAAYREGGQMTRPNDGHRSVEALTRHLDGPMHRIIFESRDYDLEELVALHRDEHTLTPRTGDAETQSMLQGNDVG